MLLRTFGGVAVEGSVFSRPKPLLLLAFLAVEDHVAYIVVYWER